VSRNRPIGFRALVGPGCAVTRAEADDVPLAGHILRAMAHQAIDLGHLQQAHALAAASLNDKRYALAAPAIALASGQITGAPGQTYTAGDLGSFTIGKFSVVVLGKPAVFDKSNMGQFNF
jgi:hypothetical protein